MSLWRCTVTVQPAEVCERRSPSLVPQYHPLLFSYSLRCHVKWCGRVACLFHSVQNLLNCLSTCSAVWDPRNECVYWHGVTLKWRWGHTGDSKTPGDEENPDPLPQRWAAYQEWSIQLPVIIHHTKWVVLNAAALFPPSWNSCIADVTCHCLNDIAF